MDPNLAYLASTNSSAYYQGEEKIGGPKLVVDIAEAPTSWTSWKLEAYSSIACYVLTTLLEIATCCHQQNHI